MGAGFMYEGLLADNKTTIRSDTDGRSPGRQSGTHPKQP
jgi:hypothetical protein